jgi:hypothetical protein
VLQERLSNWASIPPTWRPTIGDMFTIACRRRPAATLHADPTSRWLRRKRVMS